MVGPGTSFVEDVRDGSFRSTDVRRQMSYIRVVNADSLWSRSKRLVSLRSRSTVVSRHSPPPSLPHSPRRFAHNCGHVRLRAVQQQQQQRRRRQRQSDPCNVVVRDCLSPRTHLVAIRATTMRDRWRPDICP